MKEGSDIDWVGAIGDLTTRTKHGEISVRAFPGHRSREVLRNCHAAADCLAQSVD
jgi:succinate dehydrogenase/fumarate reductase flavoprotein subunit